jgi:hypothetical protein
MRKVDDTMDLPGIIDRANDQFEPVTNSGAHWQRSPRHLKA